MTITKDQAQMLATLAAACRPNGARRWDTAGTMAALAKLTDRSLAEVILATIRAATDRDADTPGVIPTAGPHWREQVAPPTFVPRTVDRQGCCSTCSLPEHACRMRWGHDHEFRSIAQAAKEAEAAEPAAVHGAVAALRAEVAETPPRDPTHGRGLEALADRNPKLRAKVDALREQLPKEPPMREPEETA